jgi:NADH:ubiquinone oxidoreductase subunit
MSAFHTPRYRITWTDVTQGSTHDLAFGNQSFAVWFGLSFDATIWFTAAYFRITHKIFQDGQLVKPPSWSGWIATDLRGRPNANIVISHFWSQDSNVHSVGGLFSYRPTIAFEMWGPGHSYIASEFASAEQDRYFIIRS